MTALPALLVNGQLAPATRSPEYGRGLQFGDGVFRTVLKFAGRIVDFEAQMTRLLSDAAVLGMRLSACERERLQSEMQNIAAPHDTAVLKLILTRCGYERGYTPQSERAERFVFAYPAPRYPAAYWQQGIAVARAPLSLGEQPALAGIKHLNRLEQVLAYRHMPDDVQEMLLCDASDRVVCGARSNVFWIREGVVHTPALLHSGVRGHMRTQVLERAAACGLAVRLDAPRWAELLEADEVFVTNSLIGVWPVRRIGTQERPAPGPLTRRIAAALAHPQLLLPA